MSSEVLYKVKGSKGLFEITWEEVGEEGGGLRSPGPGLRF